MQFRNLLLAIGDFAIYSCIGFANGDGLFKAIARRDAVNEAHVRRMLRLNYLAPDIVEAIVEGRQPSALTVRRLLQPIPCAWEAQRAIFGFVL